MSNPAERLHKILTRSKDKELQRENMMQGWRYVLCLSKETDDLIVMNKVGKVFTLPSIISTHVQRFAELRPDLYLNWCNDLVAAFRFIHFNGNFQDFSSRLSDKTLGSIEFCADQLEMRMPEKTVSRAELDAIRELAWDLYREILRSAPTSHLSRYLLDHLYLIIEAIDDYDITGVAGIERSLNTVVGSVATDRATAAKANESDFGARFWEIVTKLGTVLTVGKTVMELAEGFQKLIQHQ